MENKISCIISAYNEEKNIGRVLKVVQDHPLLDEIIVIEDGSSDGTRKIIKRFKGIRLLAHKKNRGKLAAVLSGIRASKNDMLLFIDADLVGLSKRNITDLISPVVNGESDISLSLRGNSLGIFRLIGLDFISGERVLSKKILGSLKQFKRIAGFGFESFLNRMIIRQKLRIKVVHWDKVIHVRKSGKIGFLKGSWGDISMLFQIIRTIGFLGIIKQNKDMISLRVK